MNGKETWKHNGLFNGNSNFSADDIREIRARCRAGQPRGEVADLFGVAYSTIDKIMTGKTFRYVPDAEATPTLAGAKRAQEELLANLAKDGIYPVDESKPQAKPEPGRLAFMEKE